MTAVTADWASFIQPGSTDVLWSEIILTGWSGGAGIAHHIATQELVHAVGLFEFPRDPFDHDGDGASGTPTLVVDPPRTCSADCAPWVETSPAAGPIVSRGKRDALPHSRGSPNIARTTVGVRLAPAPHASSSDRLDQHTPVPLYSTQTLPFSRM